MTRLPIPAPENAPSASQPLLAAVKQQLGTVPNLMKVLAHSPSGLGAYLGLSAASAAGEFDAGLHERIALTVAEANGCEYCLAAHTYLGKHIAKLADDELAAARDADSEHGRIAALLRFTRAVVDTRGKVEDFDLTQFFAAGYGPAAVVEVVAQVALNVFTNYVNNVARTTVDFPPVPARAAHCAV